MNTAIIVAAGSGKRFGSDIPKQFLNLQGKPLIIHTIERFEQCELVDEIILVLSPGEIESFKSLLSPYSFAKITQLVEGGEIRAESVRNGLNSVNSETAEVIAVHDGARPLVSVHEIFETIKAAQRTGAACLVASVTDTIKQIENGVITRTVDRENLVKALTPQCFDYKLLKRAFENDIFDERVTDECFLVEKLGVKIEVVEGSPKNIKITHEEDLRIAEMIITDAK